MQHDTLIESKEARTYQPINSYGVVGDCRSALLISPDGSVDWGSLPDFDSPALFCRLLDKQHGGYFQVAPTDRTIRGTQRYLADSNVLQTTFASTEGTMLLTDFMPVEALDAGLSQDLNNNTRRHHSGSCHYVVRKATCLEGEIPMTMTLKITSRDASSPVEMCLLEQEGRAVLASDNRYIGLAVVGASRVSAFSMSSSQESTERQPSLVAQATLCDGECLQFVLGVEHSLQAAQELVEVEIPRHYFESELANTLFCWRRWAAQFDYHGPLAGLVRRNALTMKLLTCAPGTSGAVSV